MNGKKHWWVFLLFGSFLLYLINTKPVNQYIEIVKQTASVNSKQVKEDPLLTEIIGKEQEEFIPPINAKMDRVWKVIPGYNGRKLDVGYTYYLTLQNGVYTPMYKEILPTIQLKDLPPGPIYRGNLKKPMVALMFNVSWGEEWIPDILQILHKKKIKATFFLDGSWVKKNEELARLIADQGHEIGNHGYSHPLMSKITLSRIRQEILKTNEVIQQTTGKKPLLFAPPAGDFNQKVVDVAYQQGMKTILWTVDTIDWKKPDSSVIVHRVLNKIDNGNLVLMHPTEPTSKGLEQMVDGIIAKGLMIGTVSEVLSSNRIN
ncbi:polysaccharide deacetylase family protein [Microaerobacter geothermalis]|uniref:polysaccharide deacetylase family protein n=1 Tax=Microaerobacter geothermalis TaxID=674972 RepID=UPI001F2B5CE6|nr:polysaccharide deacetylase family protein [Microaerobacter geothermalis]MCF6093183.1 polysaccharide deacetylase family protein [Microaerobacter geothermalis]